MFVNAFEGYGVETMSDFISLLVRLKDSFSIVPDAKDSGLTLDSAPPHAPETAMAI